MSKKKNETVAMAVNNNTETVTDAGNKVGTNTTVGIDAASNLHTGREIGDETVMDAGIDNGSAFEKGGVIDVAAVIGATVEEVVDEEPIEVENGVGNDIVADADSITHGTYAFVEDDVGINHGVDTDTAIDHGMTDSNSVASGACADIDLCTLSPQMRQGFPLETFSPWARNQVAAVCQTVQAAVPIAANLLLSLIAGFIARIVYVCTGIQIEPANLWTMTLAAPGERKTPVFTIMQEQIMAPVLNLVIGDITIPAFLQLMDSTGKLIGIDDELELFERLTNPSVIGVKQFLKTYDEALLSYNLFNRSYRIERASLTLGLAGQPEVFLRHYRSSRGQLLRDGGFFDRIQIVIVQPLAGMRDYMQEQSCAFELIGSIYRENMSRIAALNQVGQNVAPIRLRLSPEAELRRRELQQSWEHQLLVNEDYRMISGWISKAYSLILRLAENLYIMDCAAEGNIIERDTFPPISVEVVERAIRLAEYYRDHMIQVHNIIGDSRVRRAANHLLQYMEQHPHFEWRVRDLQQAMRNTNGLSTLQEFNEALQALVDQGIVIIESRPTQGRPVQIVRVIQNDRNAVA